jgi:hypothetical protein
LDILNDFIFSRKAHNHLIISSGKKKFNKL